MSKDKHHQRPHHHRDTAAPRAAQVPADDEQTSPQSVPPVPEAPAGAGAGGALAELPEEAVLRLERELDELKDQRLRLAAEYDNFRKRTARERAELSAMAQAEVLMRLVDALDDLARFAHVDPAATDAKTLHEGIDLVERKFWKQLSALGLTRLDQTGVPFDPQQHEAVTTGPAAAPEQDHTVGMVLQPGYKLGNQLVRPARVQVLTWQGAGGAAGEAPAAG